MSNKTKRAGLLVRGSKFEALEQRYESLKRVAVMRHKEHCMQMDGMTRLLGVIVQKCGEQQVDVSELEAMEPGRVVVIDHMGAWTAKIKDGASDAFEMSVVPEELPEEYVDKEARDLERVRCKDDTSLN